MTEAPTVRAVDHPVLPVADLGEARRRYGKLGFSVAPDAVHPFGTANCCIYFQDGTMLEPLAIHESAIYQAAAHRGNSFVRRDQAYRFRRGLPGVSGLAFKSDNAGADDAAFRTAGIHGGQVVRFSREMVAPGSTVGTDHARATFELAFAADLRSPDLFFFTCARIKVPDIDMKNLRTHDNGVLGLSEIILYEAKPSDFGPFLQTLLNQPSIEEHANGIALQAANARIDVVDAAGAAARLGLEPLSPERGLLFAGLVFRTESLDKAASVLTKNKIKFSELGTSLVIPPAEGQGTTLVFEEDQPS